MKSLATTAPAPAPAVIGSNSLITAYNPFRLQIAEMKEANAAKKFNYEDPDDNKAARSHVHRMRGMKGDINRVHDEEKKEILETGRRIDAQRNDLIAEVDAMIDVHAKPLKEIEDRETARLEAIKANLVRIPELTAKGDPFGGSYAATVLKANLVTLEAIVLDEATFGESLPEATKAKADGVIVLKTHIAEAERREAEAEELDRLRQAEATRLQAEREEKIRADARKEAEDRAARQAEEDRQAAARREAELLEQAQTAERQRREAEEAAAREREEAHQRAEQERLDAAAREERIARETEERVKREQDEAAAAERLATEARESNRRHRGKINAAAVDALVAGGMSVATATKAITLIAQGKVPCVSVAY